MNSIDMNVNEIDLTLSEEDILNQILGDLNTAEINSIAEEALKAEEAVKKPPETVEVKSVEPKAKKAVKVKKERKPRVKLAKNKDERILNALGSDVDKYVLLERNDSALPEEEKAKLRSSVLDQLQNLPQKIANRLCFFIEYVSGKSGELNRVAHTALKCLVKDGYVSASSSATNMGNLQKALVNDEHYAPWSASSMGANTVKAMQALKIVMPGTNGKLVANPESCYLEKLKTMLKL